MAKAKLPPAGSSSGTDQASQCEARLAAALRANLTRRKAQARGRAADTEKPDSDKPE